MSVREDEMTAEVVADKLTAWFPFVKWEAVMSGGYCCIWVRFPCFIDDPRFRVSEEERVARARSWRNALIQAKKWAWKKIEAAKP